MLSVAHRPESLFRESPNPYRMTPTKRHEYVPAYAHPREILSSDQRDERRLLAKGKLIKWDGHSADGRAAQHDANACTKYRVRPSLLHRLPSNGLRADPFAQYPIELPNGNSVPETMDYFYKVFGPGYNAGSMVPGHRQPAFSIILPLAQGHDIIFHGLMTICRATWQMTSKREAVDDPAFVYHRGKALAALRQRLSSNSPLPNDVAMMCVLQLLETEFVLGNLQAVDAHMKGLRKMLKLHHSTAASPCAQMIQGNLSGVEAFLRVAQETAGLLPSTPDEEAPPYEEDRQYPVHPFDPDLCDKLSKYPKGFSDLAMDGSVSIQILNVLDLVRTTMQDAVDNPNVEPQLVADEKMLSVYFMKLENNKNTPVENYLLAALAAFCLQLSPKPKNEAVANRWVDKVMKLYANTDLVQMLEPQRGLVLWACTSIAGLVRQQGATCDIEGAPKLLNNIAIDFKASGQKLRWKNLEPTMTKFFWTEIMGARWQEIWMEALNAS